MEPSVSEAGMNENEVAARSERSRVRRFPERGAYDRETIYGILDDARICHVGLATHGGPVVIPTLFGRVDDTLYIHGSPGSRLLRAIRDGSPVSVTVTIVDGLVLAKSLFHHSINYRSVVAFGHGHVVEGEDALDGLRAITEQAVPGRWDDARVPNEQELRATKIIAIDIEEASAKIRTGPPHDDDEDLALPFWTGVVPVHEVTGEPVPDVHSIGEVPDYLR